MADTNNSADIPHGEHLTFVDMVKAKFHPEVQMDESGKATYPRYEYLSQVAKQRKAEADAAKKQGS